MNAPHEKLIHNSENGKKGVERLFSLTQEQKILVADISNEIAKDIALLENALEVIDKETKDALQGFFMQAELYYNSLVEILNELDELGDTQIPEGYSITTAMAQIKDLNANFTDAKLKILSGLTKFGYDIVDSVEDTDVSVDVVLQTDDKSPSADTQPEAVDNLIPHVVEQPKAPRDDSSVNPESSVEADVNNEGIEALADMYRSGSERVFLNPGTEQRKNLRKKIVREIILVLKHEGYSQEKIGHFQNEVLNRLVKSIKDKYSRLHYLKSIKTTDSADLDEISTSIDSDYEELLNGVRDFLQTEKVATEEVVEAPEVPEIDIDEQFSYANAEYQELRDRFREAGLKFSKSAAIKEIGHIQDLNLMASMYEKDLVVAKNKKQTYLKSFLAEIENLKREIEQAIKTKPLPAKIKIPPIVPSGPKVEAEEEVLKTDDEASNLDLVSSDPLMKKGSISPKTGLKSEELEVVTPKMDSGDEKKLASFLEDLCKKGTIESFSYLPGYEEAEKSLFEFRGRKVVIAKINDGYLPFYQSLSGTDGKKAGKWYPFFGFGVNVDQENFWFIKGSFDDVKSIGSQIEEMDAGYNFTEIQEILSKLNTGLVGEAEEFEDLIHKVNPNDNLLFANKINNLIGEPLPGNNEFNDYEARTRRIKEIVSNLNLVSDTEEGVDLGINQPDKEVTIISDVTVEPITANESTPVVGKTVLEERMLNAYQLDKIKAREAKKFFIEMERVYQERLRNYYENQSLLSKAYGGTKKLFGLKPKLPMELEKMQLEYKKARKLYAGSLNDALTKRGFAHVGNKEFIADSDTSKRAFGTKFILRPNQELLNVQLEVVKDQETKSRFKRIVKFATKNKTLTRGLGLVAASGIGAATGLGAGLGAARWLASTTAGVAVAGYTAQKMQAGVDRAGVKSQEARNKAVEDYSLIDFDSLESAILDADFAKSRAELRQTATVVGTAVAVGGVAGLGTSYIPDATPSVTLTSIEGVGNNSENIVPVGLRTSIPAEAISHPDDIGEYLTPSQQSTGRNFLDGDVVFQQETPRSPYLYPPQTSPDSVNIVPENISANNVVDIDAPNSITEAGSGGGNEIVEIEEMGNEVVEEVETNNHQYQVKSGDTLWSIIEQQYAQELQGLSASKKMEILDRLFDRIQANPELIDSLGLRSGDIDLIYANENINLGGIDEEMDKLLGGEETIAEFKKSASIPVVADNTTVDIPIKVIEEEIPTIEDAVVSHPSTIENVSGDINGQGEVVSEIREIPKPPRPFSVDGNYFEHPDYKKYIEGTFNSQKSFDLILDRVIEKLDNETYDAFNRDIYDSPYSYFGDKTLDEIEKFQERSNSEVRAIMQVNNIKYETYLAWLDLVDEMKDKLPYKSQTRLSDLFSRHVAENLVTQPKLVK